QAVSLWDRVVVCAGRRRRCGGGDFREARMKLSSALICAPLLPEMDRESGSKRIFDLVMHLSQHGCRVTYFAKNGAGGERYARLLRQRGIATYTAADCSLDTLVAANRFDLAILAFWYVAEEYLDTIRRLSPRTHVIVDPIDLHLLRNARKMFAASNN